MRKGLEDYQQIVRQLSTAVNGVSVDWQDEVYSSLQTQVANVATASRQVMESGSRTCDALARFERIMEER